MIHICIPPIYLNSINVHRYIDTSYLFDFCSHLRSMIVLIDVCIDPLIDPKMTYMCFCISSLVALRKPIEFIPRLVIWHEIWKVSIHLLHHPDRVATKMMDIAQWSLGVVVKLVVADASFGAPGWNIGFTCGTVWKWALKMHWKWWWWWWWWWRIEGYFGVQKIMRQPWSQLFARGCPEHQWILSQKGAKLAFGTCIFVFQPCNYSIHTFTGHPAYKHIDT